MNAATIAQDDVRRLGGDPNEEPGRRDGDLADRHRDAVVVAVDGSEENTTAIEWAADAATHLGRRLDLVTVIDDALRSSPYVTNEEIVELADEILDDATRIARDRRPELDLTTEAVFGHASRTLLGVARHADLLVLGRRGRGAFGRMLLGSVSAGVGNHAGVPTVVVPKDWDPALHRGDPILVGIDGSPGSATALEYAATAAERLGAKVRALHAWGLETLFTAEEVSAYGGLPGWRKDAEELLAATVDEVRARHPQVTIVSDAIQGHPVATLSEESRKARMLVVGGHRAGRLHAFMVASTTNGALYHACCPVVVVPRSEPVSS